MLRPARLQQAVLTSMPFSVQDKIDVQALPRPGVLWAEQLAEAQTRAQKETRSKGHGLKLHAAFDPTCTVPPKSF
jgi:hypothetical protein